MADFGTVATNIGSGLGGFIGGITTPIFGGTTEVQTTTKPSTGSGTNWPIILGIVGVVVLLGIVGYFVMKS